MSEGLSTYEVEQPWVIYHYGLTHDGWWPFWTSTRVLGRMRIICECAVCGNRTMLTLRIPRFGRIPERPGRHPAREAYLAAHQHSDLNKTPILWVRPLLNPAAAQRRGSPSPE